MAGPHVALLAADLVARLHWLLPPHKTPSKESKPLGTKPVYTSLHLALSAPRGENTEDGPKGATTTRVGGLLAELSTFPTLVQLVEGNYRSSSSH